MPRVKGQTSGHPPSVHLNAAQRQARNLASLAAIRELIETRGSATYDAISALLEIPTTLIYQDITHLEKLGYVERTGKSAGIILTGKGKEKADNVLIIRSGDTVLAGERGLAIAEKV